MENFRLYKREKLCSHTAINLMFAHGKCVISYPLRAVYRVGDARAEAPVRFMITIPKKKIRKAVGRVLLRRRTREAYRLNRALLVPALAEAEKSVDVAFIYLSKEPADYAVIEEKMKVILDKIRKAVTHE
ncbi:MAG: ribonuclease P protein component [Bacteroidales bacterium]|nr:ribonuclease P protein component [Bacteroidales bacterium]